MLADEFQIGKSKVRIIKGDITEMATDAIVNAANSTLMGGGGVDGAIHRKGGFKILEECRRIRQTQYPQGLPTGKAVLTSGGNLKAESVIHTVGPVWHGGNRGEPQLLMQAYLNSLEVAASNGLKSIAFPSISTGAYGYPIEEASRVALKSVKEFLEKDNRLDEVIFVLFSNNDLLVYQHASLEILVK
jgi:O-acetyl-ADP-ribose deacetylase (regulator of RNase III)